MSGNVQSEGAKTLKTICTTFQAIQVRAYTQIHGANFYARINTFCPIKICILISPFFSSHRIDG